MKVLIFTTLSNQTNILIKHKLSKVRCIKICKCQSIYHLQKTENNRNLIRQRISRTYYLSLKRLKWQAQLITKISCQMWWQKEKMKRSSYDSDNKKPIFPHFKSIKLIPIRIIWENLLKQNIKMNCNIKNHWFDFIFLYK
jgi:hypothetical protein